MRPFCSTNSSDLPCLLSHVHSTVGKTRRLVEKTLREDWLRTAWRCTCTALHVRIYSSRTVCVDIISSLKLISKPTARLSHISYNTARASRGSRGKIRTGTLFVFSAVRTPYLGPRLNVNTTTVVRFVRSLIQISLAEPRLQSSLGIMMLYTGLCALERRERAKSPRTQRAGANIKISRVGQ